VNRVATMDAFKNAVAFLSDPNSQNAPLAQRIQFLEAKGLSGPEIDQAIRLAASPVYQPALHNRQWDWRDYFVRILASRILHSPHPRRSLPWCPAR
jgi:peroxin-14